MPSPACTVQSGSGTPQVTPPVASVSAFAEVTIALADSTGVDVWAISCISADETTSVDVINTDLSVNVATKTATFTAPAAGKSLLFESVVNQGRGRDGKPDPLLRTTFKIAIPTADSYIVLANNETREHDPVYGYTGVLNQIIRGGAGSGGASLPSYSDSAGAVLAEKAGGGTLNGIEFRRLGPGDIDASGSNTVLGTDGSGKTVLRKVTATDFDATGETSSEALFATGTGGAAFRQLQASDINGLSLASLVLATNVAGAVIVEDPAGTFKVRKLRNSDLAPDFAIASFNKTAPDTSTLLYARGSTITGLAFSATYSNGTPESASITISTSGSTDPGDIDLGALTFNAPFATASYAGSLKRSGAGGTDPVVTFQLRAIDNDTASEVTFSRSITFTSHVYWGVSAFETIAASNVFSGTLQAGFQEALSTARGQTRTVSPSTQYVYFVWPSTYGTPTAKDSNGQDFPLQKQAGTLTISRNGVTRNYDVWRSEEILTQSFTVTVS